jgi:type II secretory pathway pseudopilin PulG
MSTPHGGPRIQCTPPSQQGWERAALRMGGFTMVEVLVVLAILVMLFGLLFTPLMTGMQMFTQGEQSVARQDASALAYKQVSQELSGAYLILDRNTMLSTRPTPLEAATGQYDFSRITFIPSVWGPGRSPQPSVVEFWVDLADPAKPYNDGTDPGPLNTYVLYRGQWSGADLATAWANWSSGAPPDVLSALTPKGDFDVPSNTVFADGSVAEGYWVRHPVSGSPAVGHQIRGVQFTPQQITGEQLRLDPTGSQYVAEHGYWEGPQYNAADLVAPAPLSGPLSGPMAPRITVYRVNPVTGAHEPFADTDPETDPSLRIAPLPNPATCFLSYDSFRGRVVASQFRWAEYPDSDGDGSNDLIPRSAYEYNLPGMGPTWKVVGGSIRVYYGWPLPTPTNWRPMVRSDSTAYQLQPHEFNLNRELEQTPWAVTTSHLTFSSTTTPDVSTGRIWVSYQVRNNFFVDTADPTNPYNGVDDIVRMNYFTRELLGVAVTVAAGAAVEKVDPEATPQVNVNEALMVRQSGVVRVNNMPLSPAARAS